MTNGSPTSKPLTPMPEQRTKSQRAAEARYNAKRRGMPSLGLVTPKQAAWIDARKKPGESRAAVVVRLLGIECV